LDYFFVIKGNCSLVFDVNKVFDRDHRIDPKDYYKRGSNEDELALESENIKKLSLKLKEMLIKPYFKTEITNFDILDEVK
jgi:hypothetical protein